ncbi:uncharacterized protein SCODWIG_01915 [Saccharomycodes ludwigii]|uniref:Transmembrane and coiled-coil domain-containing protein 4 n=1 Tax=Saccharomycodes ludwigii TaxID=36035 RepID=A0A376B6Q5_9ASCO|nr:uncharacterized protein SCODWIG_01915 [Saccharomycodes ludwigii]
MTGIVIEKKNTNSLMDTKDNDNFNVDSAVLKDDEGKEKHENQNIKNSDDTDKEAKKNVDSSNNKINILPEEKDVDTVDLTTKKDQEICSNKDNVFKENLEPASVISDDNKILSDDDSDLGWQEMPAVASHNVYNEHGDLELHKQSMLSLEEVDEEDKDKNKSTFGYTKVDDEKQAQRSQKTNKKIDFLFSSRTRSTITSQPSLSNGSKQVSEEERTYYQDDDDDHDDDDDDDEHGLTHEEMTAEHQLSSMKSLLSDREKIAYVGSINVLIHHFCTQLAERCLGSNILKKKKLAKRLHYIQKNTGYWQIDIMNRLYHHLDLSSEEVKMIENLTSHGVELDDLCKSIKVSRTVSNPFEEKEFELDDTTLDHIDQQKEKEHMQNSGKDQIDTAMERNLYSKNEKKSSNIIENNKDRSNNTNTTNRDRVELGNDTPERFKDSAVDNDLSSGDKLEKPDIKNNVDVDVNVDYDPSKHIPHKIISPEEVKEQSDLDIDVAWTIICDFFLLLLSKSSYDARSRTILITFAKHLNITRDEINHFEKRVTEALEMEQSADDQVWVEEQHMTKRKTLIKKKKLMYIGLATIGGSLVLGLSGGLLAPVIGAGVAAGLSTIGITGATGFLTGAGGTAIVAVTSTAIGANIGHASMKRRMGSVKTFEFKPLHNNRRINLIISVSGWMIGTEDDVRLPFSTVDPVEGDLYSLYWEPEMLRSTGQTINILASEIITQTIQQILGATILTAFMAAIQWPMALSKLGYIIDNPWNVSLDRAWNVGLILADTILSKNLGDRPITLIGFSLGSRVIYSCLIELCKRGAVGLVENVIIFGSPIVYNRDDWAMARSVVSGRFVNGYSNKDWVLGYLFRATSGGMKTVAGLSPIESIEGIENFDCTEWVEGHMAYRKNIPKLLKQLGISVLSEEFVEIDDSPDPENLKKQRELIHDLDEAQKKLAKKGSPNKNTWLPKWFKPKKQKWQEMVEESAIHAPVAQSVLESPGLKDPSLVDTKALVSELNKIRIGAGLEETNVTQILEPVKDGDRNEVPINNGLNFQLLSAGHTVLPKDDDEFRGKGKPDVQFSDNF